MRVLARERGALLQSEALRVSSPRHVGARREWREWAGHVSQFSRATRPRCLRSRREPDSLGEGCAPGGEREPVSE
jgi:hypothetical protein